MPRRAKSQVRRNRINALLHRAAQLAGCTDDRSRQERGAILWVLEVVEAVMDMGSIEVMEGIAELKRRQGMPINSEQSIALDACPLEGRADT